jgi:hypothetical protein
VGEETVARAKFVGWWSTTSFPVASSPIVGPPLSGPVLASGRSP